MLISVQQFVDCLVQSGLQDAAEVRELQQRFSTEGRYWDAESLASHLIQEGKLTHYQSHVLRQGRSEGLVVGDYVVLDKIGIGGMGEVFKAVHRRMDRTVALKVLSPKATKSADLVKRFQREARAVAKLEHPNIVAAYDAGDDDGTYFLVMQYIDGCDLSAYVRDHRGCLSVVEAVDYILQAARGLEHAHAQGILHRDIKPSNLLLDRHGVIKILDLGLAIFVDQVTADDAALRDRLTVAGERLGTANYMSPEQSIDTRNTDARSDIYSLGCTLFFLLTGEPPFRRRKKMQIVAAHQSAPIPSLCQQFVDVPPSLDAVFQKMLAKQPDQRYQTMSEVVEALETVADGDLSKHSLGDALSIDIEGPTAIMGAAPASLTEIGRGDRTVSVHDTVHARAHQDTDMSDADFSDDESASDYIEVPPATESNLATTVDSPDRRVALWVLHSGGGVVVNERQGKRRPISDAVDLPPLDFVVETVGLAYNRLVVDEDLARLADLSRLARLYLDGTGIGDKGLSYLPKIDSLVNLALGNTNITDAGLTYLRRCKKLRQLSLYATNVSNQSLPMLLEMTSLEKLNVARTAIDSDGIEQLCRALAQCEIVS